MYEGSLYVQPNGQFLLVFYQDDVSLKMRYTTNGKTSKAVSVGVIMGLVNKSIYLGEL